MSGPTQIGATWRNVAFYAPPFANPNDDVYLPLETGPVLRPPLVARLAAATLSIAVTCTVCPNLLLSTLGGGAAAPKPFAQYDWPNPRGAQFPLENRSFLDPSEFWLLKDQFFGAPGQPPANLDWPVPKGPARVITERTWTQNLLQSTLAPSAAAPFAQFDWPNPVRRVQDRPDWIRGAQVQLLVPLAQYDWPNPRGPQFPLENRSYLDPSEFWLLKDQFFGAPGQPPANLDWPVPKGQARVVTERTWTQNLLQSTLAPITFPPIAQYDWPNPRGPQFPLENRGYLDPSEFWLLKDQFFGAPGQPPANLDWPVPKGPARVITERTWTQNLLQSTLAPIGKPFAQLDWPNPRGAVVSFNARGFTFSFPLPLVGKDQFFGAPGQGPRYDYPNPIPPRPASQLRTWLWSLPPSVLASGTPPPLYGFGARSRVGTSSAPDTSQRIGTASAPDTSKTIGTEQAADPNKTIGSSEA